MYKIFFLFSFSFSIENEKNEPPPFAPHFGGVLVPLSPSRNLGCDAPMPEDTFLSEKQKFDNYDHFCPDDLLKFMNGKLRL